jgi:hypothetical protein
MSARSRNDRLAARRRHPSAGHAARPRTLALLDVENLLPGDPVDAGAGDYARALSDVATAARLTRDDSVVLAVGSHNDTGLFACLRFWPEAAVRCRSGRDGADRALTDHIADVAAVARGYQQVVIGSGDHHFVTCVTALSDLGVRTKVVSRKDKLSRHLRRVAGQVLLLPVGEATGAYGLAA